MKADGMNAHIKISNVKANYISVIGRRLTRH